VHACVGRPLIFVSSFPRNTTTIKSTIDALITTGTSRRGSRSQQGHAESRGHLGWRESSRPDLVAACGLQRSAHDRATRTGHPNPFLVCTAVQLAALVTPQARRARPTRRARANRGPAPASPSLSRIAGARRFQTRLAVASAGTTPAGVVLRMALQVQLKPGPSSRHSVSPRPRAPV